MITRDLLPLYYSAFSGLSATHTHYIHYIYSAFSGLPTTHYIPYIYSAFGGLACHAHPPIFLYIYSAFSRLPTTYTHYIPYILFYSAFSGLPVTYTHYFPYTARLVGCPTIDLLVGSRIWCGAGAKLTLTDPVYCATVDYAALRNTRGAPRLFLGAALVG